MNVQSASATEEKLELVRSRSSPAVLILGLDNRLLYSNQEAFSLLKDPNEVPVEVLQLCEQVKARAASDEPGAEAAASCALLNGDGDEVYSLRAFLIGRREAGHPATHVMVLVEKVADPHEINLKKAKARFSLSNREIEVVALVAQGLSNKDIGCKLFLSEHTVKDHLKNIARKMGAASRGEIIAMLK